MQNIKTFSVPERIFSSLAVLLARCNFSELDQRLLGYLQTDGREIVYPRTEIQVWFPGASLETEMIDQRLGCAGFQHEELIALLTLAFNHPQIEANGAVLSLGLDLRNKMGLAASLYERNGQRKLSLLRGNSWGDRCGFVVKRCVIVR